MLFFFQFFAIPFQIPRALDKKDPVYKGTYPISATDTIDRRNDEQGPECRK